MLVFVALLLFAASARADQAADAAFVVAVCAERGDCTDQLDYCGAAPTPPRTFVQCDGSGAIVTVDYDSPSSSITPAELGALEDVTSLTISVTAPGFVIAANVGQLTQLTELLLVSASSRPLPALPSSFAQLTNVQRLVIAGMTNSPGNPMSNVLASMTGVASFVHSSHDMQNSAYPPNLMANWNNLESVRIAQVNNIDGSLPEVGQKSRLVDYIVDGVVGPVTFDDDEIFHSPRLESFVVRNSLSLSGTIYQSVYSCDTLTEFEINGSDLAFELDARIGQLRLLEKLRLAFAHGITGGIPPEIEALENLLSLFIVDTGLSGNVPAELGQLHRLEELVVVGWLTPTDCTDASAEAGTFNGELPVEVLELLHQSVTEFTLTLTCVGGTIADIAPVPSEVTLISLADNRFVGGLPEWLVEWGHANDGPGCLLGGNLFCYKPSPYSADSFGCDFSRSGTFDACGVCEGDGTSCLDCNGDMHGSSVADLCDICNGDNACLDCMGTPHGSAVLDVCGVCGGTGAACEADCAGTPYGTAEVDNCGVCGGDNACADCSGQANGALVVDDCGVCGGHNLCRDCSGVINGAKIVDACGECVDTRASDYRPACFDCAGVANGTAITDVCGFCPPSADCDVSSRVVAVAFESMNIYVLVTSVIILFGATVVLCATGWCAPWMQ